MTFNRKTEEENRQFVEKYMQAWEQGHGSEWVGTQLGITADSVRRRAKVLRSFGVKLPTMVPGAKPVNVEDLNNMIQTHTKAEGYRQMVIKTRERHGEDFYKNIGKKGTKKGKGGFFGNKKLAREAGRVGGLKGRGASDAGN